MQTRLTRLLGIRYPIIQGGLAHLAFADLAAAVSNAGGLGQIAALTVGGPAALRDEIRRCRALTDQPFGVNLAIGRTPLDEFIEVIVDEAVPVISVTGGNPEPVLRRVGSGIKKMVLVAGVRQAQKAEAVGADVVMAVGQEGGGHIGRDDVGTLVLIPRIADSVGVAVVAGGGITDGRGVAAAMALGADGVEMGTRFVATAECIAHPNYKQRLLEADERDTRVIERTLGRPGRALVSAHVQRILELEARGVAADELLPLVAGKANKRAIIEGHMDEGFAWAGQAAGLIRDIPTVAELIERTVNEVRTVWQRVQAQLD